MTVLTVPQTIQYARNAGFSGQALTDVVAMAIQESSLNTNAYNNSGASGILQIKPIAAQDVGADYSRVTDPQYAFNTGYKLYQKYGFSPWASYTSGDYRQYLPQVSADIGGTTSGGGSTSNSIPVLTGVGNVVGDVTSFGTNAAGGVANAVQSFDPLGGIKDATFGAAQGFLRDTGRALFPWLIFIGLAAFVTLDLLHKSNG